MTMTTTEPFGTTLVERLDEIPEIPAVPPTPPTEQLRPGTPSPGRRPRLYRWAAATFAVALAAGIGGGYAGGRLAGDTTTSATPASASTITPASNAAAATQTVAQVAAAVSPSVVEITVTNGRSTAEGSGVVIRSDGLIITNAHVVSDAASGGSVRVKLANGTTVDATVLGADPNDDIAVIKAQGVSGLRPATLGSSASLHIGDTVIAVGSPLGLDGTVTSGIVSALNRTVQIGDSGGTPWSRPTSTTLKNAIQTDAAINPGNSGGALADAGGNVVGITTAMASVNGDSGSIGLGFAIPIDHAMAIAKQLLNSA
jgi:putative serine protease PepD